MVEGLLNESFTYKKKIFVSNFDYSRGEKTLCDVTLRTLDGKSFQCHKNILYYSSGFFRGLLESTRSETNNETIELNGNVDSDALELGLEYIYKGKIQKSKLNADLLIKLYQTAYYLNLGGLTNLIENVYLIKSLSIDNCLILWRTDMNSLTKKFRQQSIAFIKKNCVDFLNCHLLELNPEEFNTILSMKNLECAQEILLSNILKWLKADLEKREKYVKDFVKRIKIEDISQGFVTKNILEDESMYGNIFLLNLALKVLNFKRNVQSMYENNDRNIVREYKRNPLLISESSLIQIDMSQKELTKLCDYVGQKHKGFSVTKYKDNDLFFTDPDICEYNENLTEFNSIPSMLNSRSYHASFNFNNNIYCCGGVVERRHSTTVEVFDLNHMKWLQKPSMNYKRACFDLIEYDERLYAIGGNKQKITSIIEYYDPRIDEWNLVPVKNYPEKIQKFWIRAIVDTKNKVYVVNMNEVLQLKLKSHSAEIVHIYNIEKFNNCSYPVPFIYQEELYLYCRDIITEKVNWLKLNENKERIETVHFYDHQWSRESTYII